MMLRARTRPSTIAAMSLLLSSVTGCGTQPRSTRADSGVPQMQTSGASSEIAETIEAYLAALERGDAAAAADYWDTNVSLLGPGLDLDYKRTVEGIRATFEAGTRVDILSRQTVELFVHGDAAYEIARAEEVFIRRGAPRPDTVRNNIFVRWKKGGDGKWRFHRVLLGPQAAAVPGG